MLETARMRLMPWQPEDWLLLRPLATDPEVVRYISGGEPWPDERIREWAAKAGRSFCEVRILFLETHL